MRRESSQNRAPHIDPRRPGAPSTGLPAPNRQITWDRRKSWLPKPPSPSPPEISHGLDGVAAGEPVLVPETVEDPLRSVPLLVVAGPIVSRIRSMIPVNGPSFGRRGGLPRRYPGGTENDSILRTVLRSSPNTRQASRVLIPSTRHARRTRAYKSTRYIPRLPVRATLTEGYRRSHFGPPQPDQPAASVGDYCAAVLRKDHQYSGQRLRHA